MDLLTKLENLKQRDIDTRTRLLKQGRLYGDYAEEMQAVHVTNAKALHEVVAEHGWPGIARVGLEGCRVAWFIAQHSICTPELQREFLAHLEKAAESGDAPMKQVAFLTDRILFNEGKPQVYGTVLDWEKTGELGCDLADPNRVDELRTAVGLPPFADALLQHRREVEAEGGTPPEDFAAYKQAGNEWARKVGWR